MSEIVVEFKEVYMPHPVKRLCINMTREDVIKAYGLDEGDIEWYRFIEEE